MELAVRNKDRQITPSNLLYYGTRHVSDIKENTRPNGQVFSLVELAGTAPASAGLSWLYLSYRFSLFAVSRQLEKNKQMSN